MAAKRIVSVLVALVIVLSFVAPAIAQPAAKPQRAKVSAALNISALQPGKSAELAIVIDVARGLHAQSHKPLDDNLIPLTVKLDSIPSVSFGDVEYPAGEIKSYPALGQVSVYTGRAVVRVPIAIQPDAPIGPVKIAGTVHYQACDDKACFFPEDAPFELQTEIVSAGMAVTPTHSELFASSPVPPATNVSAAPSPSEIKPQSTGIPHNAYLYAFSAAFFVGIIFNVMPCVLPVVPLKIMGFYEVSQHDRRKSLALGAVFSAGIIASFGVLALLIVVLHKIDWGGLFQQTWFTVAIVTVLVLMAISLFGFFTVNLPTSIYSITPRHDTYVGNFLFGILTAALSTPCTFGMFVGLLAWALSQPPSVGVALVMMVGVGMAFPYFVLSAFPQIARNFPRAGPWAEVVKQSMGFLLLATAVYFSQPLFERFVSDRAFWWTMFAVIAAGGVFLVVRAFQLSSALRPRLIAISIAIAIIAPSVWAVRRLTIRPYEWQPYTDQALARARAEGKPILIDFTATWCGNCHWVEASVLHNPRIIRAVHDHDVVMIKADVTDDTAPGRPLLAQLAPAGAIPLTAVYAPHSNDPELLKGIYSVDDLVGTLSKTNER